MWVATSGDAASHPCDAPRRRRRRCLQVWYKKSLTKRRTSRPSPLRAVTCTWPFACATDGHRFGQPSSLSQSESVCWLDLLVGTRLHLRGTIDSTSGQNDVRHRVRCRSRSAWRDGAASDATRHRESFFVRNWNWLTVHGCTRKDWDAARLPEDTAFRLAFTFREITSDITTGVISHPGLTSRQSVMSL